MKRWQKLALSITASGLVLGGLVGFFWPTSMTLADTDAKPVNPFVLPLTQAAPTRPTANVPQMESTAPAALPAPALAASPIPQQRNSLQGSAVDGEVSLNPDGKVRLNLELRRVFDYYLSRAGELPNAQLLVWIEAQFDANYAPAVAAQLKLLLANYLSYARALNAATAKMQALSPAERLAAMIDLRRQMLGADLASAFFAHEQAWDQFTVQRLALAHDSTLTAGVRAQREQELVQQLPPMLAQNYVEQMALDRKLSLTLPENAGARSELRTQMFGAAAAERFSALEQTQADFSRRVRRYLAMRDQQHALSDAARAPLRAQFFSPNEAARVAALEAIGQEAELLNGHY